MKFFFGLIALFFILSPAKLFSQVDSITVTHYWDIYIGDTALVNIVDSFSTGIHISEFTYDSNSNPINKTNYNWNAQGLIDSTTESFVNGAWVYTHQVTNEFYPNDSLHISIEFNLIYNSGIYDTVGYRTTITFDSLTRTKIVFKEQMSTNVIWYPSTRSTSAFDLFNHLTYYLLEYGVSLQPGFDKYIFYLPNDSIDYYFYRTYQLGVVNDTDSVSYSYLSNGYLDQKTTFIRGTSIRWTPYLMVNFTYSPINLMLSLCNHLWLDSTIGWYCFNDTTWWAYNSNNQIIETGTNYCDGGGGYRAWYFYDGLNRLDSSSAMSWPHSGDTHFWYSKIDYPIVTSVNMIENEGMMCVYPTPTSSNLLVKTSYSYPIKKIEITDVSGRLIHSEKVDGTFFSTDISILQSGIYYLTAIFLDDKQQTKRFIKMN